MFNELFASTADGSSTSTPIIVALITTAGTVLAAGAAAVAATFRRGSRPPVTANSATDITADYVRELRRRAEHAEYEAAERDEECVRLRGFLLAAHLNPETGAPL